MSPKIGINLSPVNYWTPRQPFLDRMKTAGDWAAQGPATQPLALSPRGEPANFPAGATMVYCMVGMDSPGQFVLLYDGTATFQLQAAKVVSTEPGKIAFTWDATGNGQMQLIIRSGVPSNIHVVRSDQLAEFQAGEIFTPDFLDDMSGWSHFRCMDWLLTNSATAANMPIAEMTSYSKGVPLSTIAALANKTGARPWITLYASVSDDGAREALAYLKANLRPGVRPIVEFGNEIWNTGLAAAKAALVAPTVKPGNAGYWYGLQVARMAKIARSFGFQMVAMWQYVVPARFTDVYSGFKDGGGTDGDIEAVGGANYLTGTLNDYRKPDALALLAAGDVSGALDNAAASLPALAAYDAQWVVIAKAHGWKYWTYEGGNFHLNTAYFGTQAEPLRAQYQKVQEHPRAGDILSKLADGFFASGGDAMTVYNYGSPSTVSGYFGIRGTPAWAMYRARLAKPDLASIITDLEAVAARLRAFAGQ